MEPMEAALFLSAITDVVFRLGAGTTDMTPEEFEAKVKALQIKADNLEDWLKTE